MLASRFFEKNQPVSNEYFTFPFDSANVLTTTRHGGWAVLSEGEHETLKSKKINPNSALFEILEKAGIILTERNINETIANLRERNGFLFLPGNYHVIAITNQCNFQCVYCHPDSGPNKEAMTDATAKRVLDFIFSIPAPKFQIVIEGGEPLSGWDLMKFIFEETRARSKEQNKRFKFSFTTNLSLMTDKIAGDLAKMKIAPCVSLDGPKDLHDRQRSFVGGGGTYDQIVYWQGRLKEKYGLKIKNIPVITNISLKYGPEPIIDEYLKFDQDLIFLKPFRLSGRALSNAEDLSMKPADFYEFWRRGVEYCLSLNKRGIKIKELNALYFINNILTFSRKSMCHNQPCGAGVSQISYNFDGTIYGCDSLRGQGFFQLGHAGSDNYQTVRERAVARLLTVPDLSRACADCPFIAYCGVCLADQNGFSCQWQKLAFAYLFKKLLKGGEDAKILRSW